MLLQVRSGFCRTLSRSQSSSSSGHRLSVLGKNYVSDDWTNLSPKILSVLQDTHGPCSAPLHSRPHHPLQLLRSRISNFFYKSSKTAGEIHSFPSMTP
ncbi:putative phenylalanyl-tRNA synthetase_ mitochondrial [Caligus rogercresseyi]|uniref:Putative phenylalanyl-tRNA synthetase_ mitochondrial n=1 Tax=Caligus rogercresseyi TaxID=217165 RepID=A0A7T8KFX6_CALRO|nr:putative phenylalanyl-tRNA synthetase_ mitochondrial [Caligus rogercresseyi]